MLRDVDELGSDEVCEVLALSPENQRVLLHRGRSRLRQALEDTIRGSTMIGLRRHELVCIEVVELVTDYLEGALSRRDTRRFDRHLAGCAHCTEYLAQMRRDAGG